MGVILDSCVWVGLTSGELEHQTVIAATGDVPVFVSVISLGELAFGVESCVVPADRAARAASLRQIEARPTLPVTRATASIFGLLAAAVKQAGRSPRPRYNDLWLAAQAVEHGYALATLNADDFASLPGLQLIRLA